MSGVKTGEFPERLFIVREKEDDSSYLVTYESEDDTDPVEDGEHVAIYELREVKTKRVTHAIE